MTEIKQLNWQRDNFENIEEAWDGDLWERKRLGIQLTNYVDRLQCGAVLALDARWGEGKTWFVRHWQKHLENENHNVIYLDAFANDYLEDPFITIAAEISQAFKGSNEIDAEEIEDFNSKTASVLISLAAVLPIIAAKAGLHWIGLGGAGEAFQEFYKDGKEIYDTASEEIANKVKEQIEKKIENHPIEKQTIQDFKNELAKLAEKLDKPLVFIIDELDRCRPDFAIRLIERIKHFFDIPKIVFVLVMNKPQLLQSVKSYYGYDSELNGDYFEKFIDLTIKFPNLENFHNYEMVLKEELYRIGEIEDKKEFNEFYFWVLALQLYKKYNSRELIRKINQYAILRTNDKKKDLMLIAVVFDDKFSGNVTYFRKVLDYLIRRFNLQLNDSKYITSILIKKLSGDFGIPEFQIGILVDELIVINEQYNTVGAQDYKEARLKELYLPFSISKLKESQNFSIDWKNYINSGFMLNIQ